MSNGTGADRFPRSAGYNPDWVLSGVSGAAHALWMAEWLSEPLALRPGTRVLDLGCGRALSSIFLHREFGAQVWAVDLWFSADENLRRVKDAGAEEGVFPLHADARDLPFPAAFFDAIVSHDAFMYFGTDDLFLNALAGLLKPGGRLAIAGSGLMQEIDGEIPEHLRAWWTPDHWCLHSAAWWKRHWERTGLVEVDLADVLPDGWRIWRDWHKTIAPGNTLEIEAIEADRGRFLGYVRVAGRRTDVTAEPPVVSVPSQYTKTPLLRGAGRGTP